MESKIRILRKSNHLSQKELANMLNVHQTAVSQWEMGRTMPDVEILKKISAIFGVSVDSLLNDNVSLENNDKEKAATQKDDDFDQNITKAVEIMNGLPDDLQEVALSQLRSLADLADKTKKK